MWHPISVSPNHYCLYFYQKISLHVRCLCDGMIPRPGESYCMRASVCVSSNAVNCNNQALHLRRVGRRGQTKKEPQRTFLILGTDSTFMTFKSLFLYVFHTHTHIHSHTGLSVSHGNYCFVEKWQWKKYSNLQYHML